jgi:hypothetical protein
MPNVEYFAPWFRSEAVLRSMSYDRWKTLTQHAQRICRYVVCDRGEPVVGEGFSHPRNAERERFRRAQLDEMGEQAAAEYLRRA